MLKGAQIQVAVRIRPLLQEEIEVDHTCEKLEAENDTSVKIVNRLGMMRYFKFNSVFDMTYTQEGVYRQTRIKFLIEQVMSGFHATIFAYGQTGSGKTFTMDGPSDADEQEEGMIPRAIRDLFSQI